METPPSKALGPADSIETRIRLIRGHRVMLDRDLAELYGVTTKRLNEQVKRNRDRFPDDFMFQLNPVETETCNRSQSATGSQKHRDPRYRPYAFTEPGAVMVANVLQNPTAIRTSILVVRAFVHLREMIVASAAFAEKLAALERRMVEHDQQFAVVFDAIRRLMQPPPSPERKPPMGF